jgi:hypothetical protein
VAMDASDQEMDDLYLEASGDCNLTVVVVVD